LKYGLKMVNKMIRFRFLIILAIMAFGLNACYYDNVEYLYPDNGDCDTTNISYSTDVWPIINSSCTACHNETAPSGNISLENYDEIKVSTENGELLGTIRHENGWSPMPKGGNKLPDCDILKIEAWQNSGYLNN